MGAKGLKALLVDQEGNSPDPIADPETFKEANKALVKAVKADVMAGQVMPALAQTAPYVIALADLELYARNGTFSVEGIASGFIARRIVRCRGENLQTVVRP